MPSLTLHKDNCINFLDTIESQTIDLIIADPPYNLSAGKYTCKNGTRSKTAIKKGTWDEISQEDFYQFNTTWLEKSQRILKQSGTIFVTGTMHNIFQIQQIMQFQKWHILNFIIWYKPNASPNLSCRYFTHSCEYIIWASPKKRSPLAHYYNYELMRELNDYKQMRDMWVIPTTPKSEKKHGYHPCQKPLKLINRFILAGSEEGDLVLDPFLGSGTTAVSALFYNRNCIGIDLSQEYLDIAYKRHQESLWWKWDHFDLA